MDDPLLLAVDAALRSRRGPRADVGRLLGLDSKQVNRLFNGERRLQRHEAAKLEAWLKESGDEISPAGTVVPLPGMVPLYGWVGAASENRLTLAEQSLRGYVQMHPNQAHVRDPFALEVADVSMSPRYEPGEIVYLAPNRWPMRGQDCVVVTRSAAGVLKRYVGRDEKKISLHQLNPDAPVSIAFSDFESMHTVVGRG